MALGYCPAILQGINEIAKDANPMYKVQPNGFTSMLIRAGSRGSIKNDSYDGHKKTVTVKYRPRVTVAQTDTSASCEVAIQQPYSEASVSVGSYRQSAFHLADETLALYCNDASKMVSSGGAPSQFMTQEVLEQIFSHANAVLHGVNQDLLGLITWGRNKVNNVTTAVSLNLPKDTNVQPINNGITKLLGDYKKNGLTGRPQVVGQGLFLNYILSQGYKTVDQAGFDSKIAAGMIDFWNDDDYEGVTAVANQIGVFEPNSVQLVEYLKYQGEWKSGVKPGASTFFTMPLPMLVNNEVVPVWFDVQLKYNDCARTIADAYSGGEITVQKGWQVIISKDFGLFQVPFDSYRAEDPNHHVNGALRYNIANDCDTCS